MNETMIPTVLLRTVLWRRLDEPAFEYSRLAEVEQGYVVSGRVLTVLDAQPAEVHYSIFCRPDWRTRQAHATVAQGMSTRQVRLERDESNRWRLDQAGVPALDGIEDIDLSISPSTNTLAIRRMNLAIGESRATDAAWVRFPDLTIERLQQRYTRESAHRYRYESGGGAFTAHLDVDELGIVVRYGDLWERIAPVSS